MKSMATTLAAALPALGLFLSMTGCDINGNGFSCGPEELEVESPTAMTSAGVSLEQAEALATGTFDVELVWTRDPVWRDTRGKTHVDYEEARGLTTTGETVAGELRIDPPRDSPRLYELRVDDPDDKPNSNAEFNCRNTPDFVGMETTGALILGDVAYEGVRAEPSIWGPGEGDMFFELREDDLSILDIPWEGDAPEAARSIAIESINWRYTIDGWEGEVTARLDCDGECSGLRSTKLRAEIATIVPVRP